jgi:hypothetical protein
MWETEGSGGGGEGSSSSEINTGHFFTCLYTDLESAQVLSKNNLGRELAYNKHIIAAESFAEPLRAI